MPIEHIALDEQAIEIQFHGLIQFDELVESYQYVLSQEIAFLLLDGQNMMYRLETLFDEQILGYIKQLLEQPTYRKTIIVLPKKNPLRQVVNELYANLGVSDKVQFVETNEQGRLLIQHLQAGN